VALAYARTMVFGEYELSRKWRRHVRPASAVAVLFTTLILGIGPAVTPAGGSDGAAGPMPGGSSVAGTGGASPLGGPAVNRAIGQMLMTHVDGLTASPRLLARIRAGEVGSVILYSENIAADAQVRGLTATLQAAARAGGNPPLLIGTDQEGGPVKRVLDAPPTMSAEAMGRTANPHATAEAQGLATGKALLRLGIDLDFAPVSDIPTTRNNFLGERVFGYSARQVVEGATGFAVGLARAHVGATAKHFPGLGGAGNHDTDLEPVSIGLPAGRLRAAYAPYRSMAEAGPEVAPLVMISNAAYPTLTSSDLPADLSPRILHQELALAHMSGRVTITDDMEAPGVARYPDAPIRAALAGEDILMFAGREAGSERAFAMLREAVRRDLLPAALVVAAGSRVEALKHSLRVGF
jgi:beta-N-acetylhexosaminidase